MLNYCDYSDTIRHQKTNCLVAFKYNGRWVLDIDTYISLNDAQRIFKAFYQLYKYADVKKLVNALNGAINIDRYVKFKNVELNIYHNGNFNKIGLESLYNKNGLLKEGDKFNAFHDVQSNVVRIWINDHIVDELNIYRGLEQNEY